MLDLRYAAFYEEDITSVYNAEYDDLETFLDAYTTWNAERRQAWHPQTGTPSLREQLPGSPAALVLANWCEATYDDESF